MSFVENERGKLIELNVTSVNNSYLIIGGFDIYQLS